MYKKIGFIIIVLFVMIALLGCYHNRNSLKKVDTNQINAIFEVAEGNSLLEVKSNPLPNGLLNKTNTFSGKIYDTGVLNLFYTYTFDGENIFSRMYYLKERIYKKPHFYIWGKIVGKCSEENKKEIDTDQFERLDEIDKKIEGAKKHCCRWVERNRMSYDLNNYKRTNRFKKAFKDFEGLDLNKTKFQTDNTLVFLDFDKQIAGISCGRNVLRENVQRGDYLSYLAICNLDNMRLIKVIIKNTGYFLE